MSQEQVRVTGHLKDAIGNFQKTLQLPGRADAQRTAFRLCALSPGLAKEVAKLAFESSAVQGIIDEMIAAQSASGTSLGDLAHEAWLEAAIIEARAREHRQVDRYYIYFGSRRLGPHHMDLLRLWAGQEIISEDIEVMPENGIARQRLDYVSDYFDFPEEVMEKLEAQKRKMLATPIEKLTRRQQGKLDFFLAAGVPHPTAGLHRARASVILNAFMVMDPETERRYQKEKQPFT